MDSPDGASLLSAHKRAANILRIEGAKDGPHDGEPDLRRRSGRPEETELAMHLAGVQGALVRHLETPDFTAAMRDLASLRAPLDAFFDKVTVNDPDPTLRRNRLNLLHRVRVTMDQVADFSRIEG